ncbi:DUF4190 domain-containing protein [Gordonia westfalica]|nr:DUF4190 domain-containing protein [Gordonia westfalica]
MTSDDERSPNTPTSGGGASERARELWSMSDDARSRDPEPTRPGPIAGSPGPTPTGGSSGTAPWERVPSAPISAPSPPRGRDAPDSARPGPRGPFPPSSGGPAPGGPAPAQRPGPPPGGPRPPGGPGQPGGPRPQPPRSNGPRPGGDPVAPPRPAGAYTTGPGPRPAPGNPSGNPGPTNPPGRPPAGHRPPPGGSPQATKQVPSQGNPPQRPPGPTRPDALGGRPGPASSRPEAPQSRPDPLADEPRRPDSADATMFVTPAAATRSATATRRDDETPGSDDRTAFTPVPQAYSANTPAIEDDPEDNVAPQSGPRLNRLAVWALILSGLGITFPIGLVLGYRARAQIRSTRETGLPFANVAIWLGWAYLGVLVFGLLVYGWILFVA